MYVTVPFIHNLQNAPTQRFLFYMKCSECDHPCRSSLCDVMKRLKCITMVDAVDYTYCVLIDTKQRNGDVLTKLICTNKYIPNNT